MKRPRLRLAVVVLGGLCTETRAAGASDASILHYTARLHGVALLAATVCLRLDATRYAASLSARTLGLAEFLVHGRSEGHVDGTVDVAGLKPRAYAEHGRLSGEKHEIAIDYLAGSPVLRVSTPPQEAYRLPIPVSALPGSLDGLSTVALQSLAATRTGACLPESRVFDGRQVRRLTMRPAGTDRLARSARSIFSGQALRCETDSVMLAGFLKSDSVKSQSRPRHGQLWLAPAVPGGPMMPVRITFDAELLGDVIVDLDAASASKSACGGETGSNAP